MKMLLILGGYIDYKWAAGFLETNSYDKIIAVDGGLSAANLLNIYPDCIIGDFDTVDKGMVDKYEKNNIYCYAFVNGVCGFLANYRVLNSFR